MVDNSNLKVTLIMVMSANGVVAQDKDQDSFEWNSDADRDQLLERIQSIGTVLMGANTYRIIEDNLYEKVNFFVLSHHPASFRPRERVSFIQGEAADVCRQLCEKSVKHVALLGGTETNAHFLDAGRVDDIYLTIEPLLLPGGFGLTKNLKDICRLTLESVRKLENRNTLLLHYRVLKEDPGPPDIETS